MDTHLTCATLGIMDKKRLEKMRALRKQGLSYTVIGAVFGISRQRAHQLLDKNYLLKRKGLYTGKAKGA